MFSLCGATQCSFISSNAVPRMRIGVRILIFNHHRKYCSITKMGYSKLRSRYKNVSSIEVRTHWPHAENCNYKS